MISLVLNPVDHAANKHIRVYCHFSPFFASWLIVAPQRVASEDNVADVLTKALGPTQFKKLMTRLVSSSA